ASRIAIEGVQPSIDAGRFSAKAVAGWPLRIEADIFCDGHEVIAAALEWRARGDEAWREEPLRFLVNDRWRAEVTFDRPGPHQFRILSWRDLFAHWRSDTLKKQAAGQDISLELEEGKRLVEAAIEAVREPASLEAKRLIRLYKGLRAPLPKEALRDILLGDEAATLMSRCNPRTMLTLRDIVCPVFVDRSMWSCSACDVLIARSLSRKPFSHGTIHDGIRRFL